MNWAGLVDAAVIGTARAPAGLASELSGLDRMTFDHADDQARLLDSAAATSRARRAGYRPARADDRQAPDPAEPDPRPEVGLAAQRRLAELIANGDHDLVAEWLRLLAATPRRPPDALLPGLLAMATGNRAVRADLVPVLGPLATWLGEFIASWKWAGVARAEAAGAGAVQPDAQQLAQQFGTGGLAARAELLSRLRAHDPAAARDLLASTWPSDPYRERATLLATFATGLSLDDEPLAELGLADRRVEVRQVAADLLAKMAGSRYSVKAAERAAEAVRVERKAMRQRLVVVVADVTEELVAEVPGASIPAGAGARAWLLQHVVAAAPAGFWAGHTGVGPADLLALAEGTDWTGPLRDGWTRAAIRDANAGWLTALLDHPTKTSRPGEASGLHLLAALPARERDEWLCANPGSPLFGPALESLPAPWSVPVSERVRSVLADAARADPGRLPMPRALLRLAALRLEPPAPPRLDPALVHDRLARAWNDLQSTLSIRAAMRREIAEEPYP